MEIKTTIRLTEFTKGGGCGCKLPPAALREILSNQHSSDEFGLIVGNSKGDDAAVWDMGNDSYLVSTTDFFTPIVDDPYDFGRIAAANSISDVYAMGGTPVMAISILGWPTDKLPNEIAAQVLKGARDLCASVGIAIGGGHSIENPEPIFGLAVNGIVAKKNLKRNHSAKAGDILILTKPIGSGILSAAMKRGMLSEELKTELVQQLVQLNKIGEKLGKLEEVHAMTDVTGFGLIGHTIEMAEGSGLSAQINYQAVPLMNGVSTFTSQMIYPDNTMRNWKEFSEKVGGISGESLLTLCDPQTNGGLLIAVDKDGLNNVINLLKNENHFFQQIGVLVEKQEKVVEIV
ncbi:MAG: selenide, water dikinase SelD [Bacteroidota bacterium]|jgi:selenide,water dikinase